MDNNDPVGLGITALREGRIAEARGHFERARVDAATYGTATYWLGVLHFRADEMDLAEGYAREAVAREPGNAGPRKLLGLIHHRRGNLGEAADAFREELGILTPDFANALANLGRTLLGLGDLEGAETNLARAHAFLPEDDALAYQLANTLHSRGRYLEAAALYKRLLERSPESANIWNDLGSAEAAMGEQGEAVTHFQRALELDSSQGAAFYNLGQTQFSLGEVDDALESFADALRLGHGADALTMAAVIVPGCPKADARLILEIRKKFAEQCLPNVRDKRNGDISPSSSSRPLRVGYVSAFLADRNWMKPIWGLVNNHDRTQFEVHLFFDGERKEIAYGYEARPTDKVHETGHLTNEELAAKIAGENIDLLVDLNGYSRIPRLGLLPLRPAPVVVGWFNHFATTGIPGVDYLIGDDVVVTPEEEEYFTEKISRVPGSYLTFDVRYPVPEVAPAPCLTKGSVTFGALCSRYKITPAMVVIWSRILHECPESQLILRNTALRSASNRQNLREQFARQNIGADRVVLEGPVEHYQFLQTYDRIDVALDTFPYNGGTTTSEAIWQGVPVLTTRGDRWVARTSESLLRAAGLDRFVAPDPTSYVAIARSLAEESGRQELALLRKILRERARQSSACDTARFARNMEAIYRRMMQAKP